MDLDAALDSACKSLRRQTVTRIELDMKPSRTGSALISALCLAAGLHAQGPAAASDSARSVAQRFYDWYVPRAAHPREQDVVMVAATRGPLVFDPELVRWLRIDSTARARAKDEVDGLDGDPFLNAQDPCDAYTAQAVRATGSFFLVEILGHGGCEVHTKADVVVELTFKGGRWMVTEFRDPNRRSEGLIPLLKRLHPKSR